jgi:hypothetical protein
MTNDVFWDVMLYGSCKNRSFRGTLVMSNVVPSSPILVTLMMEALSSSETSVLTRVTWRNIPGDDILHSHCRENLKSYNTTDLNLYKEYYGAGKFQNSAMLHNNCGVVWKKICGKSVQFGN